MSAFENPKALGQIMQQHAQDALFWRALNDVARANRLRDRLAAMDLALSAALFGHKGHARDILAVAFEQADGEPVETVDRTVTVERAQ